MPAWLEPLLPLLTNVLLTPDLARVQPYQPPAAAPASTPALTQTVPAPAAPAMVLLEFVRSQAGEEARVLVNLDRTYSIASAGGVIEEGELARDEMAALLRLLEAADLRSARRRLHARRALRRLRPLRCHLPQPAGRLHRARRGRLAAGVAADLDRHPGRRVHRDRAGSRRAPRPGARRRLPHGCGHGARVPAVTAAGLPPHGGHDADASRCAAGSADRRGRPTRRWTSWRTWPARARG